MRSIEDTLEEIRERITSLDLDLAEARADGADNDVGTWCNRAMLDELRSLELWILEMEE
jgi:hypothetical protein